MGDQRGVRSIVIAQMHRLEPFPFRGGGLGPQEVIAQAVWGAEQMESQGATGRLSVLSTSALRDIHRPGPAVGGAGTSGPVRRTVL